MTANILSNRGRTIRPKTLNQKRYVDAIDSNKDGSLSRDEMLAWRRAQSPTATAPAISPAMIATSRKVRFITALPASQVSRSWRSVSRPSRRAGSVVSCSPQISVA